MTTHPPLPPFNQETARQKVQADQDAWNTCDRRRVSLDCTEDSVWRNRDFFVTGREEIMRFLVQKWERELHFAQREELWAFAGNRIAVRFQYECRDRAGQWWRCYGTELLEFDRDGLMSRREASINDVPIKGRDRRISGSRAESGREGLPLR